MTDAGRYGPDNFIDPNGKPVKNTPFSVRQNGVLSTLYTDAARSSQAANPGMSDALGNISFYADPGYYDLTVGETTLSVAVDTIGGSGISNLNVHEIPFPSIGTMPGSWQGHPAWNDDGPQIHGDWSSQDSNAFAVPFKGISPLSAVTVWGNGFTCTLTGTLLGPANVDVTVPIITVPDWSKPTFTWTFDSCDSFTARWAYMDEDQVWHVLRTDTNLIGSLNTDGELTIPEDWPEPPDGADSVLLDFGVSVWFPDQNKTMPVGWAHRAKTEVLDSDAHVAPDVGTIFCDGLANLWTAGDGHTYQDGMQVHVLTGAASVMVSDYESDEPFLDPAGVAVHSYVLPAHTHAVLSRSNGTWRLSVLGANQTQTVPVTPAPEAATTAPTWYHAGFDGGKRISGIIAGKVDLGGVIASVVARLARVTSFDGSWSDKWYMIGVQTADGTTWASGMTLVSPVDPDEPTIFDLLSASPLPAIVPTPTYPSHAANKGYVDDVVAAATTHSHAASDVTSGTLDIARIPTGTSSTTVPLGNDSRLSDARTPTAHKTSHSTGGGDALVPSDIGAASASHSHGASDISSGTLDIARIPTGTSASTVAIGNDSRLSDSRTPTSHASSHASAGSDPLTLAQSQVTNLTTDLAAKIPKSLVDAKGDIVTATADDTPARLAVGSNGQILTADSAASTGVSWGFSVLSKLSVIPAVADWWSEPHDTIYTGTPNLSRVLYVPFYIPAPVSEVNAIAIEVTTVIASGLTRLGLYLPDSTTHKPGARIIDGGTVDTSSGGGSAGVRTLSITATAVQPDSLIYVAVCAQTASATIRLAVAGEILRYLGIPSSTVADVFKSTNVSCFYENSVTGALPTNATPVTSYSTTGQPVVALKRSA